MRTKSILVVVMVLFVTTASAFAGTIAFNDGGSHEFNSYTTDTLVVEDSSGGSPTTLSLVSGTYVDNHYVYAYDFSELNVVAGYAYAIFPMDSSTANMIGGEVGYWNSYSTSHTYISAGEVLHNLNSYESSIININGGNTSALTAYDSSRVDIIGGDVFSLYAQNSSTVNIMSGNIGYWLKAGDSALLNIYGYNLLASDTGGRWGDGFVTGNWEDGTPFTIDLSNGTSITYSHINLIPEPATLLLLAFGAVMLRRKRFLKGAENG